MSCKNNGIYKGLSQSMVSPGGSVVKNPPTDAKELGAIPGFGRSPGG